MKETDKAYLAGLFDGEGCATIITGFDRGKHNLESRSYLCPALIIANNNFTVLQWALETFTPLFKKIDLYANHKTYHLRVHRTQHILSLIELMEPYLIVKKKQCELLKEFCKWKITHNRRMYSSVEIMEAVEKYQIPITTLNGRERANTLRDIAHQRTNLHIKSRIKYSEYVRSRPRIKGRFIKSVKSH